MGLRGRALQQRRKQLGYGQVHLARAMGIRQPELSVVETEKYGAVPRGWSTRYVAALNDPGPHFVGCGCKAWAVERDEAASREAVPA